MSPAAIASISIIIPVLNEANHLPTVLEQARHQAAVEIIVVDGGSQDDTIAVARALGVRVIQSERGRAHQMNAGAAVASGKILLFLHADTLLPPHFDALIRHTLMQPGVVAGAFELKIDATLRGIRWVEWGVKWRSRLLQLPYGDQGIFLTAEMFLRVEGFPVLPIMEDFVLIQRLKQRGRIAIIPAAVLTSGRRWQKLGVFKTTLTNQLMLIAYFLGVSPSRLARWYRRSS
jgi:rSAM/selenodomain-associated transferase 2